MVGQKNLLKHIDWLCDANCFPSFCVIVGDCGHQEIELTQYIADKMGAFCVRLADNKIDTIRDMIDESYKMSKPVFYVINNADDMSVPAKNALLKVTEEPPNKAHFIMLINDINNTLDTIKSRATVFTMEPYSKEELMEYAKMWAEDKPIYAKLCSTPAEVDLLFKMVPEDFYEYVKKVVENIGSVSGANSFKIAEKVAIKDENGYDLKMFWKACCELFSHQGNKDTDEYIKGVLACQATSEALKKLSIRGVNRQMLFDEWLLNVRSVLR